MDLWDTQTMYSRLALVLLTTWAMGSSSARADGTVSITLSPDGILARTMTTTGMLIWVVFLFACMLILYACPPTSGRY